jgi:SAM-dependent methyltransferase
MNVPPPEHASMNTAEFANIVRCERDMWWFRGQRLILANLLRPLLPGRSIRRVLEAGCGTGFQSAQFTADYGWRMFPLDLDAEGLRHAHAAGGERLTQGDISHLPFCDAAFDAVVSLDVLVHFPRGTEQQGLTELVRVLRPGGLFVVRVSALDILRSRHSLFAHERQRFTRGRLQQAASQAGIRLLRCTYANSLLLPVALAKFRVWEPLTNQPPQSGVSPAPGWLDALLYGALRAESALVGAGVDLPLGQSLLLVGEKL